MIGARLGPYEVTAKLGEGGMGDVYRAFDTQLEREVAIKVLPPAFVEDRERLARFEREAKLLAQLHHPNIASIFGIEESSGTRALVMELVEGPTLDERMEPGLLPLEESLSIARQIAEALEAAHGKGIVHRDLKPQNVKLTPEGQVKVLDFGLAKAMDPGGSDAINDLSHSPTLLNSPTLTALPGTQLGVILGTAAYMAPEQARGLAVDKRADVWAFGVLLWEMLTGKRLFEGELVTDVLAAVLHQEINLDALPEATVPELRRLVKRCLQRRPKNRLHDIADARLVLVELIAGEGEERESVAVQAPPTRRWLAALPWSVTVLAIVASIWTSWIRSPGASSSAPIAVELELGPPDGGQLRVAPNRGWGVVSPDGRQIVFNAVTPEGSGLWVRPLDRDEAHLLPGTSEALYPFWSPDSKWIAFFERGSLSKIEIAGGLPERICDAPWGRGGSWSKNGLILLTPVGGGTVHRVREKDGVPEQVTELDVAAGEDAHYWPTWLPDGEHFLYFIRSGRRENQGIYLARVPESGFSQERHRVVASSSSGLFAEGWAGRPDQLLWVQEGELLARAFDPSTGALTGPTSRIARDVRVLESQRATMASVSTNGVLVHASAAAGRFFLAAYDRQGRGPEILPVAGGALFQPAFSPDRRSLAYVVVEAGQGDVWILALERGESRPLTSSAEYEEFPVWSPDSQEILLSKGGSSEGTLLRYPANGAEAPSEVRVSFGGTWGDVSPQGWLPGDWAFALLGAQGGAQDVVAFPLEGPSEPVPLLSGGHVYGAASASLEASALAYLSDESGKEEAFVVTLSIDGGRPSLGSDRQRLPLEGVKELAWRGDGRELVAITADGGVFALSVAREEGRLRLGTPTRLFERPTSLEGLAVDADGNRFIFLIDPAADHQTLTVLLDWPSRIEDSSW